MEFMPFQEALAQNVTQSASSKISTESLIPFLMTITIMLSMSYDADIHINIILRYINGFQSNLYIIFLPLKCFKQ